jgi:UbiD family decarboxylase
MEEFVTDRQGPRETVGGGNVGPTPPRDLRQWLAAVEAAGELLRIREPIDPDEELSGITLMTALSQNAPALLFENVKGAEPGSRVLANLLGSSKTRFAISVGIDPALSTSEMIAAMRGRMAQRVAPQYVDEASAPINERILVGDEIDLTRLPAVKFWPRDGGRYIGSGDVTLTSDPDTGHINMGVYRQMLHGPARVGMYCSPGKHGRLDREAWWRRGEPCPVVVAYGIDPVLFMAGALSAGKEDAELEFAGGILGGPVEVTKGVAVDLPIPAHAEIAIEGLLHPGATEAEGPLGEFTGYYGNARAPQPVIEVKALHLREQPIHTAALMANYPACEIGYYSGVLRSARILDDLQRIGVPGVVGAYAFPEAIGGWGLVAVSVRQLYAGHVAQVLALTAQCPAAAYLTKWIVAVDEDVDPTNLNEVLWAMCTRCDPARNVEFLRDTWATGLDPSRAVHEDRPYGSKALIDACKPHRHLRDYPVRTALRRSTYTQIRDRWAALGLPGEPPTIEVFDDDLGPDPEGAGARRGGSQ